jgi:hypothetical protein
MVVSPGGKPMIGRAAKTLRSPYAEEHLLHGNGAEDTSCWWLSWFSTNIVFCSFTDIRGMLSTNAGAS